MRGLRRSILAGAVGLLTALQAPAAVINLAEFAFNIDGTVSNSVVPAGVGGSFDYATGLGSITLSISGAGNHRVGLFLDHEIDEQTNTFFNELGGTASSPAPGLSWQIDEPELADPLLGPWFYQGSIYTNFVGGALDGVNHVPAGGLANDVAMALAWSFDLAAGETATIGFVTSEMAPGAGFYLSQSDPDSATSVYLASSLRIGNGGQVPEPAGLALVAVGLIAAWHVRRKPGRT